MREPRDARGRHPAGEGEVGLNGDEEIRQLAIRAGECDLDAALRLVAAIRRRGEVVRPATGPVPRGARIEVTSNDLRVAAGTRGRVMSGPHENWQGDYYHVILYTKDRGRVRDVMWPEHFGVVSARGAE